MQYDRKDMAEGETNKRIEGDREERIEEQRSLIFQVRNLNRVENAALKIQLCKPDL